MTSVSYEELFVSFTPSRSPDPDIIVGSLPNLGELSPTHSGSRKADSDRPAEEKLFTAVTTICKSFGFVPIIGELAYLSDPKLRAGLELVLNSYVAATSDQNGFANPAGSQKAGEGTAYFRAIEDMLDKDRMPVPMPIAGHPGLWGKFKDQGRVGYVTFPAVDCIPDDCLISDIPNVAVATAVGLRTYPPQASPLDIAVDYTETVEETFKRFVSFFIKGAWEDAEATPSKLAGALNRLLKTHFIGVPFVRAASETDSRTAAHLSGMGWTPARGVMLLLFLSPEGGVETSSQGEEDLHRRLDGVGKCLHALLTETGLKEAAEHARDQGGLLRYLGDIVHDTGNVIRSIRPDAIVEAVSSGTEVFGLGEWDCMITTLEGRQDPQRERSLMEAYEMIEKSASHAQNFLKLLEFRARGGLLTTGFQAASPVPVRSVIADAEALLTHYRRGPMKKAGHDIRLIVDRESQQEVIFPAGYLNPSLLTPLFYEILFNASRHGCPGEDNVVPVTVRILCGQLRGQVSDENPVRCEVSFTNPRNGAANKGGPDKYQGFMKQITVERQEQADTFTQSLMLEAFKIYDEKGRETETWIVPGRAIP